MHLSKLLVLVVCFASSAAIEGFVVNRLPLLSYRARGEPPAFNSWRASHSELSRRAALGFLLVSAAPKAFAIGPFEAPNQIGWGEAKKAYGSSLAFP
jgi:hypothetical protein